MCEIGDNVSIGGLSAVHQFVRIGHNAFLAGGSMVVGDVIPYAIAMGNRAKLRGLNVIGLRRSGMSRAENPGPCARAYKMIFDRARPMAENVEAGPHRVRRFARGHEDRRFPLGSRQTALYGSPAEGRRPMTTPTTASDGNAIAGLSSRRQGLRRRR